MDTQTAINSPPDPGGVAYFDLDADPPPAPPLDTEKFANFSATAAGNSAILLTWQLNTNIQFTCKIERRENDGNWGELTVVDSQADDTYLDESVSAGVIYHYRLTAMQGNAELFGSREKMCDVPCPVEVETPIADGEELNPLKYKFKLSNPPAGGLTLEWMEFYATGCHPDKADLGQFRRAGPKRSWTIPSGATESEEYTTAGHFESSVGCYAVVGIPRISLILGSGVPNLQYITCPEHNTPFDTKEPVFFAVNDSELPDTRYVLSWQGSDTLRVTKGGGAPLSSPLTFTQEELDSYSSFKVVASGLAGDGDSLTVNLQTFASVDYITGGEIEMGTDSHTFYFSGPPAPPDSSSLSVPVDEASGAKYRKIALNGRPLSDEKPQAAAEDDQQREETFVDALTLGLRHNVSDAWLPVNGSELALTVRRSTASEVWSERFGLRPHERPDLPFGAGWSSNLTAQVKIVRSSNDADYAYVTDENGAVYRFVIWGQNFFPFPTAKHEQNTYLTSLEFAADGNRLVFKRKFGSVLEYTATGLDYHMSHDRMNGSEDYDDISYYRLVKITDRLGQVVNWIYAAGGQQLVPMRIEAEGRADQTLYLRINGSGLVTNIWDANWNRTDYTYEHDADRDIWLLVKVTAADGAETSYGYDFAAEQDLTPQLQGPNVYLHCDVGGITDPNNQTYAIGYMFNHDGTSTGKYNYYRSDDFPAGIYYPATGEGRMVSGVTLPGGGVTQFENYSLTKLVKLSDNDDDDAAVLSADSLRKTRVRDATGRWRTYQWGNPLAHFIRTLSNYYSGKHITTPKIIYYRTMDLTHEGFGTEHYEFDVNAGLNVSRTVDLSGNETEFEYSDTWTTSGLAADYHSIIPLSAGVNGCYDDPTAQMRKLGDNWLIKDFSYSDQRVMKGMVDELGRRTVYDVDALGRRTAERVYPAGSDTPLQVTLFEYSANFPGVVTRKTMQKQAADGAPGWAADLVTQYVIDNAGRVAQEVTNPGGLALTVSREYDAQGNKISATDPNGNQTLYVYDQRNRLTRITHADDAEQVFAYDGNGNKVSATDENGHVTQFAYDPLNRLVKQTRVMGADSAGNLVTQFAYNAANAKTSQTDPNGHVTRFEYDGLQRLVKTIDALHQPTVYAYGANSGGDTFNVSTFKPTQTVDPRGYVTEVEYDSLYRAVKTRVQYNMERGRLARQPGAPAASRPSRGQQTADALSDFAETLNAYDDVGNLIHTTDPLGHVTQTTYDALNRPLTVTNPDGSTVSAAYTSTGLKWRVTDELGRQTDTRYDAAGRPIEVYAPALADGQRALTVTGYDAAGNVTLTVNPLGQAWTFAYDNRNRKISEQQPAVADAADGQTKHPLLLTAYDAVGNVTATTDANGNVTVSEYDAANRVIKVTDALGHDTLTVYDRNGNIVNVSDANGKVTHNQYDALNRLTRTTDAAGITVSYEYDAVGNRVAVTDGKNHPTRFTYDGLNRQLTESDPLNHTVTFAYDAINKIRRADAKGQITAYTYDSRNRPLTVTYQGRAQDHRQYTYDAAGNVTWATDRATVAYVYDALNRIVQETSAGRTHNYEYDLAGNRTKAIYGGSNRELVSTYDALNRLQTVSETGRVTTYAYDLNGNIAALTLPNGDVTTNLYDALNRCTNKTTNNHDNVTLSGYAQEYDHVGNVTKITETYAAAADNRVITNTYDNIYRLTRELITGAAARDTRYTYDRANNRTGKTADGEQTNYTYNAVNQLLAVSGAAGAVFDYDANGNR
ncbi:MAG: hypothetical protein LBK76_04925, partial [Verrucomicrobiales bacterium]|nr:hypothetical protein [Verrucomicrobiales bacterium]